MEEKDYQLTVKIRNNKLLQAIHKRGYETIAAFSRASNIGHQTISNYLSLKRPAMRNGEFTPMVKRIAEHLNANPFDLFPFRFLEDALFTNKVEREIDDDEIQMLLPDTESNPDNVIHITDQRNIINQALNTLTSREKDVINARMGLNGHNESELTELAAQHGVSKERIRQIEKKALRKLRHPSRARNLREAII